MLRRLWCAPRGIPRAGFAIDAVYQPCLQSSRGTGCSPTRWRQDVGQVVPLLVVPLLVWRSQQFNHPMHSSCAELHQCVWRCMWPCMNLCTWLCMWLCMKLCMCTLNSKGHRFKLTRAIVQTDFGTEFGRCLKIMFLNTFFLLCFIKPSFLHSIHFILSSSLGLGSNLGLILLR